MLKSAIEDTKDAEFIASKAVKVDSTFEKLGVHVLTNAIPNCHFYLVEDEKTPIMTFFSILTDLGLTHMYGSTMPDDSFYAKTK